MKKKVLVIGAIAATAVLAGGWALAQTTGHGPGGMMMQHMGPGMDHGMMHHMGPSMGGGMGPGMMHGGPGPMQFDPARVETLKTELGITAAQEAAWTKYAKAVQEAASNMKTAHAGVDPDAVSRMSPQDRVAFMTRMREQGQKQFEAVKTAVNELLSILDEAQKAKAHKILPGLAFGPGTMHSTGTGGMHGMHHHN